VKRQNYIAGFAQLGKLMRAFGNEEPWSDFSLGINQTEYEDIESTIAKQFFYNGWFTKQNVLQSIAAIGNWLTEENLNAWLNNYSFTDQPKKVGIIMAGNIPLVGFHDFLCVVLSGNRAVCKLSSDDKTLLPAFAHCLIQFEPELKEKISFSTGRLGEIDAIIATGSNNSSAYFEQYFGKYPHVFRKNRTSVARLSGNETPEDMHELGVDIFSYFGLGCRNVTYLMLPVEFNTNRFFEGIMDHHEVMHHNKYGNNYDYNRAVYSLNLMPLLDNNFVLLRQSRDLFSPLSVIHYDFFKDDADMDEFVSTHQEEIQVVVGDNAIPFGKAQQPRLTDYADGVDVMKWLEEL
jgi:hypothetical protein